jgi:hypothetical protein
MGRNSVEAMNACRMCVVRAIREARVPRRRAFLELALGRLEFFALVDVA